MTDYAGETFEVTSTGIAVNGSTPLTATNTTSVTVDIRDATNVAVVTGAPMTWNVDESLWYYRWDTTNLSPGRYVARVWYVATDGSVSFEFLSVRLNRPKFTT